MPSRRTTTREQRAARQRLLSYQARRTVHDRQSGRRRRDNVLAASAIVVIATVATVAQVLFFTVGPGLDDAAPASESTPETPTAETPDATEQNVGDVPPPTLAEGRAWTGELSLNNTPLAIRIDGDLAPQAASVFISLAQSGYYIDNQCHRLTTAPTAKVIQCGAPDGVTTIDPGFSFGPIENAPADGTYPAGTIAIARADSTYSQSTQFFIAYGDSTFPSADGYSVIGRVTGGLDSFVSEIASAGVAQDATDATDGAPAVPTSITGLTLS